MTQFCVEEALIAAVTVMERRQAEFVEREQDAHEKVQAELARVTGGVRS